MFSYGPFSDTPPLSESHRSCFWLHVAEIW